MNEDYFPTPETDAQEDREAASFAPYAAPIVFLFAWATAITVLVCQFI